MREWRCLSRTRTITAATLFKTYLRLEITSSLALVGNATVPKHRQSDIVEYTLCSRCVAEFVSPCNGVWIARVSFLVGGKINGVRSVGLSML